MNDAKKENSEVASTEGNAFSQYLIPLSIVVGFGLIAGALYFGDGGPTIVNTEQSPEEVSGSTENVRPVTAEDHIKGPVDATVTIIEYSDFECPFCKRFHNTMTQVMEQYADSGEVAWVFRHFPLESLHPVKAHTEAVASECVNELGGNDAFWQFSDRLFELTPSNNQTDIEVVIPQIVREIGLDETAFQACFKSGRYDEHIEADIQNAIDTGGRGTPWSVVVAPNGKTFPFSGAQPLEAVIQLIELAKKEQ